MLKRIWSGSIALAALLTLMALPAAADDMAGRIVVHGDADLTIDTGDGERTYELNDVDLPDGVAEGDLVVLRMDDDGQVIDVVTIDDEIEVVDVVDQEGTYRAVMGEVNATSTDQLLLNTTTGEQAFVINPEKLFPPVPEPGMHLVVQYRVVEIDPPLYMADRLIAVPASLVAHDHGNVAVTTEPVEVEMEADMDAEMDVDADVDVDADMEVDADMDVEAEMDVDADMDVNADVDADMDADMEPARLPQTASSLPLALTGGLVLLALGGALRLRP